MHQFYLDVIQPLLATILSILIPLIVGYIAKRFRDWTGMEMEARHREALQSALANAAKTTLGGASKHQAIDYVMTSVPDALKALGADDVHRVSKLLEPHLAVQKRA